ncbi:LysR family transcriptional regulator [Ancylobacter sp. 6x-1]|uniref:LysR family transcriptional regulator n=1 Tax=Ancylobacter crimeensis TaxID=2579147 RepID=A0ABT0D7P3_9HYPH|nr:LysR family transcriptional regulator [Ancylobacter crimeensis]MCK0195954.1 LysR family transcriptional regulator [Ancylobacter crimeensis]
MAEPFKGLSWDDFRLIKAVADARGLPAAASELGVNHSTVFRRLKQVEETLGTVLFERHRTGYAVTPAGEEMVALATRLDEEITAAGRKLAGREPTPTGDLRITLPDSLLMHLLMPLISGFRERYPDVRLDFVLSAASLNLSKRDADVAIRATDHPPENLVGRRVATINWALYGLAERFPRPVTVDELRAENWVALSDDYAHLHVVKFLHEHIEPERIVYKVNTVLGLPDAIEAGIGIGYIPCLSGSTRPALTRLAPIRPEFSAGLWLLTHPDLRHAPRVRAFLDYMASEVTKVRRLIEGTEGPAMERIEPEPVAT